MMANVLRASGLSCKSLVRFAGRNALLSALLITGPITAATAQGNPEPQASVTPLTAPEPGRDSTRQQAADERMAALLFSEAREELELGELRGARRRLEILVTRYGMTSVAPRGRRLLEQLALIDGTPVPPMPKLSSPAQPNRANDAAAVQLATRAPGASLLEADFSARGGDRLFFVDGSDDVGGRGRRVLREKANWLRRHPQVFVRIEGYADDSGGDDMNSALALRRAETVRDALVEAGVPATRVHITAFGRDHRIANCAAVECAAQNRRAVLVLTDARGARLGDQTSAATELAPPRDGPSLPSRRDR